MSHKLNDINQFFTYSKEQQISMRRNLIVYRTIFIVAVFAVILLILSFTGFFSSSPKRASEALQLQQQNSVNVLENHLDKLSGKCVDLSEQISSELSKMMFHKGNTVEILNDNRELIVSVERKIYPLIQKILQHSDCSGAFFMLDAGCRSNSTDSGYSRMGIYLRDRSPSKKNTLNKEMVFFRGDSKIAGEEKIQLDRQWRQEFDSMFLSEYEQMADMNVTKPDDGCRLTERITLKNTREEVMFLCVPILDVSGKICGICGVELNTSYFRHLCPDFDSSFGCIMTFVAPMENDRLNINQAVSGSLGDIVSLKKGTLSVKKGKYFNVYASGKKKYIGLHEILSEKSLCGDHIATVTLLSENDFNKVVSRERKVWLISFFLFFFFLLFLSRFFIRNLSALILKGIFDPGEDFSAADEQDKVNEKERRELPPDIELLFQEFTKKVSTLTPMERTVLQHYIDGCTIEDVASKAFISIYTVKKHNTNMNRKLEVSNREELMLYIELFRRSGRIEEISYHNEV